MLAEKVIFPGDEGHRWRAEMLYPAAGIAADPERDAAIERASTVLRAVRGNAAILSHAEERPDQEVIDYLARYELASAEEARQRFRFIADPTWRAYNFSYHVGRDLLGRWLDLAPEEARQARFRSLLTDQIAPSDIAAQIDTTSAI